MEQELIYYKRLLLEKFRFFNLTINNETITFVHSQKDVKDWRADLRKILNNIQNDNSLHSNDIIIAHICGQLGLLGYVNVFELACDVYEGVIKINKFIIEDEIDNKEQVDGFGHYGLDRININDINI